MASRSLTIKIAEAVHGLVKTNPQAWQLLMQALVAHADEVTDQMVASEPSLLTNYQGRAQEVRDLIKLLDEAPKLAQQLEEKEATRGQPNVRTHNAAGGQP